MSIFFFGSAVIFPSCKKTRVVFQVVIGNADSIFRVLPVRCEDRIGIAAAGQHAHVLAAKGIAAVLAASALIYGGCGGQAPKSAGSDAGKIKIGVVQIVQHGSLD